MTSRGLTAQDRGRWAEGAACRFLKDRGLGIEARNVRGGSGELDIVATDGPVLVFVEVKARRGGGDIAPQEAVTPAKRRRLVSAAGAYLAGRMGPTPVCRFDVIAVSMDGEEYCIEHLPDAFRVGD